MVVIVLKKKIISNTYLRDINKYQIKIFLDEDDYYVCVKKLIDVKEKFIISNGLCVMDNGYYIFEVIPKYLNYAMRLFLDQNKKPLEYYFDITKNNGIDELTKIPCYDDLYLDITYSDGKIKILDEDELLEAFKMGDITKLDLDLVFATRDLLLEEISNGTNEIMNIDYMKYLNCF